MRIVLRSRVLDLGRQTEEKISNNIPSFNFFGPRRYLNPTDDGVELSLTKGYEPSDDDPGSLVPRQPGTWAPQESIRHLLNEAAILNEYRFKRKTAKKK
jgi:hypothetical protein